MSRVAKRPEAEDDLTEIFATIGERSLGAAERFLAAAEATFRRLAGMPGIGVPYERDDPELADLRCARVDGFVKYLVFYRPIEGGIEVLRVVYGARDLGAIFGPGDDPP